MHRLKEDLLGLHKLYKTLEARVANIRSQGHIIYPKQEDLLNCLKYCELENIKIIITAQDPYINPGEAHGLCFSVPREVPIPPSLRNIFKELEFNDVGFTIPTHGDLTGWAQQGILLLNRVLTVEAGKSKSHSTIIGWEEFTDKLINLINTYCNNAVFMLWGSDAKKLEPLIDKTKHLILKAAHPSPLSANKGFFGCKHFKKANEYLCSIKKQPIDWNI